MRSRRAFARALLAAFGAALGIGCRREGGRRRVFPARVDLTRLHERLGESLYSQDAEETLIRAFFEDRRGGFFVDVGAGDPIRNSTTYYLEKHLGWRGIAVDAIAEYAAAYAHARPGTRFFSYLVADRSGPPQDFFVAEDRDYSSATGHDPRGGAYKKRQVATIKLDDLLAAEKVSRIDFLSLDIEGSEPLALAGLDIARYRPELVCAEIHSPRHGQAIAERLAVHGYREIVAYREIDPVNRYYALAP